MKKLIYLITIFCTINTLLIAQTTIIVSGTVTNSANNAAVPNHQVNIVAVDSMTSFYFSQSANTDSNGVYSVTIQNYPSSAIITATTLDCNNQTVYLYFGQSPYVANFSICVNPPCQAAFMSFPDSANQQTIHFVDQTIGTPTSWLWDFGDNTTSTLQNPTHTYIQNGSFMVSLTINCGSSTSQAFDTVTVTGIPNCVADFSSNIDSINPYTVHFTNQSIGNPTSYLWNFGDSITSTLQNPSHNYSQAGSYIVTLSISGVSCQSSFTDTISISPACSNSFTFHSAGYQFSFQGTVSSIDPTIYIWNFGDSTALDSGQTMNHYFAGQGNYQVCLTTKSINPIGDTCTTQSCQQINVPSGPTTNLFGQVFIDTNAVDTGYVVLYNYNWFDSAYVQIASTNINKITIGSNLTSIYYFGQLPPGKYLTKAFLNQSSNHFGNYSPTYSGNRYAWDKATVIIIDTLTDTIGHSMPINMIELNPPIGNTTVSGYVLEGTSKSPGDPIPNVPIYLLENGIIVKAYTLSDQNGYYEFNNLEKKSYTIHADFINKKTYPINVNPDGSGNPISNYNIYIGTDIVTGVQNIEQAITSINIYPNPFIDNISIELNLDRKENINIQIYNLTGQLVYSINNDYLYKGIFRINIPLHSLKSGLYLMSIRSESGWSKHKKIIKN